MHAHIHTHTYAHIFSLSLTRTHPFNLSVSSTNYKIHTDTHRHDHDTLVKNVFFEIYLMYSVWVRVNTCTWWMHVTCVKTMAEKRIETWYWPDGGFFLANEDLGRFVEVILCLHFFFWKLRSVRSYQLHSLGQARISPQWLSKPRRLWPRFFFSRVKFLYWLLIGVRSTPVLLQWHINK